MAPRPQQSLELFSVDEEPQQVFDFFCGLKHLIKLLKLFLWLKLIQQVFGFIFFCGLYYINKVLHFSLWLEIFSVAPKPQQSLELFSVDEEPQQVFDFFCGLKHLIKLLKLFL